MLRSYEATLPQHNIPLAGDTYFYRILLRLSLNSSTRNWRVRLISECRRARHSYGGESQDHRRDHHNACTGLVSALDEGRAGQKRRQRSILRSARAQPKSARSLSGCPAPLRSQGSRRRSLSPSAGRPSLVTFHDRDSQHQHSGLRPECGGRVACEGVGCSRSREQSPERAAIYDALRERDLQEDYVLSSGTGIHWHTHRPRSREQSPRRIADERVVTATPGPSQRNDQRRPASAHKEVQVGEVTECAATHGTDEPIEVAQKPERLSRPVEPDANLVHPRRCRCQQCLDSEAACVRSGEGSNWAATHADSVSDAALADLMCPGCGETFEPWHAEMDSGMRQLQSSSAAGIDGEAETGASTCRLRCRLCRLQDLSPRWRDTANAFTCAYLQLACVVVDTACRLHP